MGFQHFEDIFSGLILDALDHTKSTEHTRREATYLERILQLQPQAKVLDVPCGSGRLMIELASRGYKLSGVDIAQPSVDESRRRAQERNLTIDVEQGDMRELRQTDEFDGVYCVWESFGYFDDEGNQAFLNSVYHALKPGGRFLIDTHVAESLFPRFPARNWNQIGDLTVLEDCNYDHVQGRFERIWTFIRGEQVERRHLSLRLYTYRELIGLLESAGFAKCEGYSLLSATPFALGAPRLNLVARKPKNAPKS
jgi:SAM-dependent methyltransferase